MSHLINTPGVDDRSNVLSAAARHLDADGLLLAQRLDPAKDITEGTSEIADVQLALHSVDKAQWPVVHAVSRYVLGDSAWEQIWTLEVLDDAATESSLAAAGLRLRSADGAWVVAEPA